MKINISSMDYDVIDSGTIIAYDENADITFHFNDQEGIKFNLRIVFKNDEKGSQIINRKISGNNIEYECVNFSNAGTGTSMPIEIIPYKDKKIYIRFWAILEGDIAGKGKTRKIDYTFFLGK